MGTVQTSQQKKRWIRIESRLLMGLEMEMDHQRRQKIQTKVQNPSQTYYNHQMEIYLDYQMGHSRLEMGHDGLKKSQKTNQKAKKSQT